MGIFSVFVSYIQKIGLLTSFYIDNVRLIGQKRGFSFQGCPHAISAAGKKPLAYSCRLIRFVSPYISKGHCQKSSSQRNKVHAVESSLYSRCCRERWQRR